jgi:serine/threonine protein kinase
MDDLSKLHHPNIMGYYGSEQNKEGLYCFIEFCSGASLKELIKKKISELKVMTLLKQLLEAMTYINKMSTFLYNFR